MKSILLWLCCCCWAAVYSQEAAYFQQQTDYRITATLDDERHQLHAHLALTYHNNSPDTLSELIFHLWPRAYRSDATALAEQFLLDGNTEFHFASSKDRGDLDSLNFQVAGETLDFYFDAVYEDIAHVRLARLLPPGQKIEITTPFRVKIPASFSRLGHVETSYQLTQWYPKPAVYDRDGWHPMPYLDRGEYYSEFGDFQVTITLPDNYWVAATGELQSQEELQKLRAHAAATQQSLAEQQNWAKGYVEEAFPPSSSRRKTLVYTARNVHDFAWFADKRFRVLQDTLVLAERKEAVEVWSFFTATEAAYWQKSLDYLKSAARFYSEKVGAYPYPQVTAVQSALSAGGGMEYPMITVIAQSGSARALDEVIAHEVGHNWFYGILASNERAHAWMDEGFNSYYEQRYMQQQYPQQERRYEIFGKAVDIDRLAYRYLTRLGKNQPPDTPAEAINQENYWLTAYSLPAMALQHLADLYGAEALDEAMRAYYKAWAFRHPQPADLQLAMEQSLGQDLSWFFQGFMESRRYFDPQLKRQQQLINKGSIVAPSLIKSGAERQIIDQYPQQLSADARLESSVLDLYPSQRGPLRLDFLIGDEQPGKTTLFYGPFAGVNVHDGIQFGAFLHNRTLAPQSLEWMLAPMYAVSSGRLNGFAGFRWRLPSQGEKANALRPYFFAGYEGFGHRSFQDNVYGYRRLASGFSAQWQRPGKGLSSELTARFIGLQLDRPNFSPGGELQGSNTVGNAFALLSYQRQRAHAINPSQLEMSLEYGRPRGTFEENFLKLQLSLKGGYQYEERQWIRWRLFAGYFLQNGLRDRNFTPAYAFSLIDNATADYRYEGLFAGRNTNEALYDQQLGGNQGGLRVPIAAAFGFGQSNDYMATVNLETQLPFVAASWPLVAYLDAGTYGRSPIRAESESGFQWVGGFGLSFLEGSVGLYVPLLASPELKNLLDQRRNFLERLVFKVNFPLIAPWRTIDRIGI